MAVLLPALLGTPSSSLGRALVVLLPALLETSRALPLNSKWNCLSSSTTLNLKCIFCFKLFLGYSLLTRPQTTGKNTYPVRAEMVTTELSAKITPPDSYPHHWIILTKNESCWGMVPGRGFIWAAGTSAESEVNIYLSKEQQGRKKSTIPLQLPVIMDAVWAKNPAVKSCIYYHSISHQQIYDPFQT